MGVKAENRFTRHSREHFTRKAEERLAGKWFDRFILEMEQLENQNTALKERNAKLEAGFKKRGIYLAVERARTKELHADIIELRKSRLSWIKAFMSQKKAHQKLSAIVRLGMPPEQYHTWREAASHIYPNLFKESTP